MNYTSLRLLLISAAVCATLAGAASGAQRAAAVYFIADCSKPAVAPTRIILACGDGNAYLTDLRWRAWGRARTQAFGTFHGNDCKPSCAQGAFHSYPVAVSLSAPQWCRHAAKHFYTRIAISATGAVPAGFHRRIRVHYGPCNKRILTD